MSRKSSNLYGGDNWRWCSEVEDREAISEHHVLTTYRLRLPSCASKSASCRKTCRNPKCLQSLKDKNWMQAGAGVPFGDFDNPESEKRVDGNFVGLKNLGSTCYANSLLQVWFHTPVLRKAIYKWNPEEDKEEMADRRKRQEALEAAAANDPSNFEQYQQQLSNYTPMTPVAQLQLLFGKLQFTNRRSLDPESFVASLNLDRDMQQDAQEFCSLFWENVLESHFKDQKEPFVRDLIKNIYTGEFIYSRKCTECGHKSESGQPFRVIDLVIQGKRDLEECIKSYFSPSQLEGGWDCSNCRRRTNGTQTIELKKAPKILNLLLLRFVYDQQKHSRKKINSHLRFWDILDLSPYLPDSVPREESTYHLFAVLVHRGQSANSGHYVAHIKDRASGDWFRFNDETVERDGKKPEVEQDEVTGAEDEIEITYVSDKIKSPSVHRGRTHSSNNAYMLVYQSEKHLREKFPPDNDAQWRIPEYLEEAVIKDNSELERWLEDLKLAKEQADSSLKDHKDSITKIFSMLEVDKGSKDDAEDVKKNYFEWICKKWLTEWLNSSPSANIPEINNKHLLCQHQRMSPLKINEAKCISNSGANVLYERYGGGPRINSDWNGLCWECVRNGWDYVHTRDSLAYHQKMIQTLSKIKSDPGDVQYWVGKESFKSWKSIYYRMKGYGDDNDEDSDCETVTEACSIKSFNEDVTCEHALLTANDNDRKLVTRHIWEIFRIYFPSCPQFADLDPICETCSKNELDRQNQKESYKMIASEQKTAFIDLYNGCSRINWATMTPGVPYYAWSRQSFQEWQDFIREPSNYEPPKGIRNRVLLCDKHEKLLYPPTQPTDIVTSNLRFLLLKEEDWQRLKGQYAPDHEIKFVKNSSDERIVSTPECCEECYNEMRQKEEEQLFNYKNGSIYIKKLLPDTDIGSGKAAGDVEETFINDFGHVCKYSQDENFKERRGKRKRTASGTTNAEKKPSLIKSGLVPLNPGLDSGATNLRRSNRRRNQKDEKELRMDSSQTLRDLKKKIYSLFQIPVSDQHLTMEGKLLEENESTLAQLKIPRNSTLLLRSPDTLDLQAENGIKVDIENPTAEYVGPRERGFSGSKLLRQ